MLTFLIAALAVYTYSVTLDNTSEVVFIVTNAIAALSWGILAFLTLKCRQRYSPRTMVFSWVRPLTFSFEIFCLVSLLRCVFNNLVVFFPALQTAQSVTFIGNNICLAVACGYASVYYRKIPQFIERAAMHQAGNRRFNVYAETAVDAMIEIDEGSNIWFANHSAGDIFGYLNHEDLLGRSITDLMPEEFRDRHLLGIQRYVETGESRIIGCRQPTRLSGQRRNGEVFPIELTLTEYKINSTRRFLALIRDISYKVSLEKTIEATAS